MDAITIARELVEVVPLLLYSTLPPFQQAWRESVLVEREGETLSELERVYLDAFKAATAIGDRTRGAHVRGLQAVASLNAPRPRQSTAERFRQRVADWLAPRRGP